jgi:hypothetical protein
MHGAANGRAWSTKIGMRDATNRHAWSNNGRLAGVRLGSGSGVLGPNLNLHLKVRFEKVVNTNPDKMFRFRMFGSGSNNVRHRKTMGSGLFLL